MVLCVKTFRIPAISQMIQIRLRELMTVKGRRERRRITYEDIYQQTGIANATLTRLADDRADMVGMSVIDRLCEHFDCQTGDLFVNVGETQL